MLGLMQLAMLSNRTLVFPDPPCEAGWMLKGGGRGLGCSPDPPDCQPHPEPHTGLKGSNMGWDMPIEKEIERESRHLHERDSGFLSSHLPLRAPAQFLGPVTRSYIMRRQSFWPIGSATQIKWLR